MDEFKRELEDYFCRFTFGQFVTLILLEIVTLFFVFYLGARYGSDFVGRSQKTFVPNASLSLPPPEDRSVDEIIGDHPVEYTYPEVLTGSQVDGIVRIKPSGMTAEEYERKENKKATPHKNPVQDQLIQVLEEKVIDVTEKQEGSFAVQIGSFQSSEEATAVIDQWKQRGYVPFMTTADIPQKGIWYRVRIGQFSSREAADRFLEEFQSKEKTSALVVRSGS